MDSIINILSKEDAHGGIKKNGVSDQNGGGGAHDPSSSYGYNNGTHSNGNEQQSTMAAVKEMHGTVVALGYFLLGQGLTALDFAEIPLVLEDIQPSLQLQQLSNVKTSMDMLINYNGWTFREPENTNCSHQNNPAPVHGINVSLANMENLKDNQTANNGSHAMETDSFRNEEVGTTRAQQASEELTRKHLNSTLHKSQVKEGGNDFIPATRILPRSITAKSYKNVLAGPQPKAHANGKLHVKQNTHGMHPIVNFQPINSAPLPMHKNITHLPNNFATFNIPVESLRVNRARWNNTMAGHFLGGSFAFKYVKEQSIKLWGNLGLKNTFFNSKVFFTFQFNTATEMQNILACKTIIMGGKIMYLRPWIEGARFVKNLLPSVPVWLKLHNVPHSCWNLDSLSNIASTVGKPVRFDGPTSEMNPMKFARVLVEMPFDSPKPNHVLVPVLSNEDDTCVLKMQVDIEYSQYPSSCSICKAFGHPLARCPNNPQREALTLSPKAHESASDVLNKISKVVDIPTFDISARDPNLGSVRAPNSGSARNPNSGSGHDPNSGSGRDPNLGSVRNPNLGPVRDPNLDSAHDPNSGSGHDPNSGSGHDHNSQSDNGPILSCHEVPDCDPNHDPYSGSSAQGRDLNVQTPCQSSGTQSEQVQTQNEFSSKLGIVVVGLAANLEEGELENSISTTTSNRALDADGFKQVQSRRSLRSRGNVVNKPPK